MSETNLPADDPRLTAYALNELDASERAEVEQFLAANPECRAAVAQIRDVAGQLSHELRREPVLHLEQPHRAAIEKQAAAVVTVQPTRSGLRTWQQTFVGIAASVVITGGLVWLMSGRPQYGDSVAFATKPAATEQFSRSLTVAQDDLAEAQLADQLSARTLTREAAAVDEVGAKIGAEVRQLPGESKRTDLEVRFGAKNEKYEDAAKELPTIANKTTGSATRPVGDAFGVSAGKPSSSEFAGRDSKAGQSPLNGVPALTQQTAVLPPVPTDNPSDPNAAAPRGPGAPLKKTPPPQAKSAQFYPKGQPVADARKGAESDKESTPKQAAGTTPSSQRLATTATPPSLGREATTPAAADNTPLPPNSVPPRASAPAAGGGGMGGLAGGRAAGVAEPQEQKVAQRSLREESARRANEPQAANPVAAPAQQQQRGTDSASGSRDATPLTRLQVADAEAKPGVQFNSDDAKREKQVQAAQEFDRREKLKEETLAKLKEVKDLQQNVNSFRYLTPTPAPGTETYTPITENEFVSPYKEAVSTFSIDVDTASYSNVRRFLTQGQLPPPAAVRIEELVNYFSYDDPAPAGERPFSVTLEVNRCPWNIDNRLVRIGLKGKEVARDKRPPSNLVFLVDVSGSMADNNKLPLVKQGLEMLTRQMTEGDRVAIVTYSDTAALRLDSTRGDKQGEILNAIRALKAGGSTNGADGIQKAYAEAQENLLEDGTNRVILCTDGDFNVGVTDDDQLVTMVQEQARGKVFLSVFGFGMGNLKDGKLEKLADKGNGHYAYVDDLHEAQKVFVDEMAATLVTIAKDVKLQIEFNPAKVGAYRLIGYENRALAAQDFSDDTKDAGEIGAGHSVTALYELIPSEKWSQQQVIAGLKYQKPGAQLGGIPNEELLTLNLRFKQPDGDKSQLLEFPLSDRRDTASRPSRDFEWSAAVAGFGMLLRNSQYKGQASLDVITELAQGSKGPDANGRRQEFLDMINATKAIVSQQQSK